MRSLVAKKIRQYIRRTYGFLADEVRYTTDVYGGRVVSADTKRGLYLHMKKEFKRRKQNG